MDSPLEFKLIGLQLDLARQIETPDCIRRCFEFAANYGYNAVFLYLEDRVRTVSYPYSAEEESYDLETMRGLVSYAAALGLEVIPIVSTLGHVERFLRHAELRPLGDIRDGGPARCGDGWNTFCPLLEEVYEFWRDYLAELTGVFPSRYFHIGCDEVWNLGLCSKCQAEIESGRSVGDLFAYHVSRVHGLLASLGKRAMMWDDMLEEYPEALPAIPSDIVQCVWQYDQLVERTLNHFGNRSRDHRLVEYERLGIDYLVGPTSWNMMNTISLTDYALNFKPSGALMTRWAGPFLEEDALVTAFAGRLWSNLGAEPKGIFSAVVAELFGVEDDLLVENLWARANSSRWSVERSLAGLLGSPSSAYASEYRNSLKCQALALSPFLLKELAPLGREVLEDTLAQGRFELAQFELKDCAQQLLRAWTAGAGERVDEVLRGVLAEIDGVREYWEMKWLRRRPGLPNSCGNHDSSAARLREIAAGLLEQGLPFQGFLKVRYGLPDYYGWPSVRWSALFEGETRWRELYDANPKVSFRDYSDCPFFFVGTPVRCAAAPLRLKMEFKGCCGIGLLHLEYFMSGRVFRPVAVENVKGRVVDGTNALRDDTLACWFGDMRGEGFFQTSPARRETHSLELVLAEGAVALP